MKRLLSWLALAAVLSGTPAAAQFITPSGGSGAGGDVVGPASSTTGAAAIFADTTGKLLADSKVILTPPATSATLTIANGKTLTVSNSGTLAGGDAFVLAIAAAKTFTVSNSLTLAGTDSTTMTFPSTSQSIPGLALNNVWTRGQTITEGTANESILASTGYSLTGSNAQSMVDLAGTVNTSGRVDVLKLALTQTAAGANSSYLSFLSGAAYRVRWPVGTTGAEQLFNTYTDESNNEYLSLDWSANVARIRTVATGSGTQRNITLDAGTGSIRLSSDLLFNTDNTDDIGASGTTRPRNVYVGTNILAGNNVQAGGGAGIGWVARSFIDSPANGIIRLANQLQNDFDRLQFGGTTSSFPALKRSAAEIHVRLADDSANAALLASTVRTDGFTVATLPTPQVAGRRAYVTDQLTACAAAGAALTGGGAVVCPVFDNGVAWVGG